MLGQSFADVLSAAQTGAGWAFTRLYDDLAPRVTAYLRRQGAAEPDDVTSETFVAVFRGIDGFAGDADDFRSWVFTIAHRRLVDERRRVSRSPSTAPLEAHTEPPAEDDVVQLVVDRDTDEVGRILDTLSRPQRDVVLLRIVAGLSVAETAASVGRSEPAVRQLQHRALRALREQLVDRAASVQR